MEPSSRRYIFTRGRSRKNVLLLLTEVCFIFFLCWTFCTYYSYSYEFVPKSGEKERREKRRRKRLQVEMKILLSFRLIYKTITIIMMQREKHERWRTRRKVGRKENKKINRYRRENMKVWSRLSHLFCRTFFLPLFAFLPLLLPFFFFFLRAWTFSILFFLSISVLSLPFPGTWCTSCPQVKTLSVPLIYIPSVCKKYVQRLLILHLLSPLTSCSSRVLTFFLTLRTLSITSSFSSLPLSYE